MRALVRQGFVSRRPIIPWSGEPRTELQQLHECWECERDAQREMEIPLCLSDWVKLGRLSHLGFPYASPPWKAMELEPIGRWREIPLTTGQQDDCKLIYLNFIIASS